MRSPRLRLAGRDWACLALVGLLLLTFSPESPGCLWDQGFAATGGFYTTRSQFQCSRSERSKVQQHAAPAEVLTSFPGADALKRQYGERWHTLLEALLQPKRYAMWVNPFAEDDWLAQDNGYLASEGFQPLANKLRAEGGLAHQLWIRDRSRTTYLRKPKRCSVTDLKLHYPFDLASALPVLALLSIVLGNQRKRILDTCAAPGGKFLMLVAGATGDGWKSSPADVEMHAMEADRFRFGRLRQNIGLYLPDRLKQQVYLHHTDARGNQNLPQMTGILVDAPCSSERERLQKALGKKSQGVAVWDARKSQQLARRQLQILRSAIRRAAPNGCVVYSTCALSKTENDDVVAAALLSSPNWRVAKDLSSFSSEVKEAFEETKPTETMYGWQVLPDAAGWGPIYWSVLLGPTATK